MKKMYLQVTKIPNAFLLDKLTIKSSYFCVEQKKKNQTSRKKI